MQLGILCYFWELSYVVSTMRRNCCCAAYFSSVMTHIAVLTAERSTAKVSACYLYTNGFKAFRLKLFC